MKSMEKTSTDTINPCVSCHYARMRKDICGIYCAGEFWKKENGTCDHWRHWKKKVEKKEANNE